MKRTTRFLFFFPSFGIFQIKIPGGSANVLHFLPLQLALTILNPWNWFCSTRTLSNCLETSLTSAALYYWPWQWTARPGNGDDAIGRRLRTVRSELIPVRALGSLPQYVPSPCTLPYPVPFSSRVWLAYGLISLYRLSFSYLLAAFACILRPTNTLLWIPLVLFTVWNGNAEQRRAIVTEAVICG